MMYRAQAWAVDALLRVQRGYARMWAALKRRIGMNAPGWPDAPQDDAHAYYRTQYERLVETLPGLPRGQSHPQANERRATLLAFSQVLEGLHNYGDDPIMPPGVRRMVVRELDTTRLATFGAVGGARGLLGTVAGGWQLWALAGAVAASGWGFGIWQTRALKIEQLERAEAERVAAQNFMAAQQWRREYETAHAQVIEANQLAAQTAQNLEAERRRAAVARRRQQERERAIQDVLVNDSPPPWDSLLRNDQPSEGSPGAGGDSPAAGDPGGMRR